MLAAFQCPCTHAWSRRVADVHAERCPECGLYPVFPVEHGEDPGDVEGDANVLERADDFLDDAVFDQGDDDNG